MRSATTNTGDVKYRPPVSVAAAALAEAPFRYAVVSDCLERSTAERLLSWFERDAPWRLIETDFYEQYEFSLEDTPTAEAALLASNRPLLSLRSEMSHLYGLKFDERVKIVAHKLMPGQKIAIHNDYLAEEETHRLLIQLNRGLVDDDGGFLMLFNSDDARDVHKIFRPTHLSGVTFEISQDSFHAVSRMHRNVRYTIVYSFYCSNGHRAS